MGFSRAVVSAGEDVPETESFVPGPSDDGAAIGTHREVEHAIGVASEGGYFFHSRVLPNIDFVVGVAVGADNFVESTTEHQVTHL